MTDGRTGFSGAGAQLKGLAKVFGGFKDFISRGNAVDLAVGVVIGAAFGAVVKSIVDGLISPLVGWILGSPNLSNVLTFEIDPWTGKGLPTTISLGVVINALVTFLGTAAAVYFLIVVPLNHLAERRKRGLEPEPAAPAEDVRLLTEIRDLLAQKDGPTV
ncbi:large conductance mechanosensitive channel protein MscL [Cellulomonas soli]|uniref:Large-conductance mechanosensitive channel n=1 Tax=Cellulomonas soli TaxID=931535 RepID=A0A512PGX1_9CELL|nr:large conductance mechanosensitive channel protein MscL [Cellulomonas soli]NYI59664.1 large conductance mechanosensitive channel [Cellulomonas soli]GEP70458.1 large-conductance mechanosensitive channel [Cellulomonas soli]